MSVLLQAVFPFELNGIEVIALLVVVAGIASLAWLWRWSRSDLVMVLLLTTPVLVLTVAETTQFMTMDEWGLSMMLLDSNDRLVNQHMLGVFRTSGLIQLIIVRMLEGLHAEPDLIRMLLKAVWWLLGNCLLFAISARVLQLASVSVRRSALPLAATFTVLALLPTNQLAIKTLNYDLFSMTLGVLAVLTTVYAFEQQKKELLLTALAVAFLGAQEKLTVGPVLIVLIILFAIWYAIAVKGTAQRALAAMRWGVVALATCLLVSWVFLRIYATAASVAVPAEYFSSAVDPLSSWSWVLLGRILPVNVLLAHRLIVAAAACVSIVLFIGAAAAFAPRIGCFLRGKLPLGWISSPVLPSCGLLVVFAIGSFTTAMIVPYWAPFHPSNLPGSSIGQALNGAMLHVDATSVTGHYVGLLAYAVAVVVVAIPTGIWLIAALWSAFAFLPGKVASRWKNASHVSRNATILIVVGLTIPIATAIVGVPFAHRYFNISICLLVCAVILLGLKMLEATSWPRAASGVIVLVALLIVEVAPFRPLFAAFRPFWLSYADAARAEPGRLNPSWMGWGEEILRVGKELDRACQAGDARFGGIPCGEVTLHVMSSGLWLPGPTSIRLKTLGEPELNERTFVALSRLYLIQNRYNIPTIEPDFAVSHRGFTMDWVFRGDRLAASGYKLK